MRLILFGPPGAGKGTQAALLKAHLGLHHLSTGDLFRSAIKAGTPVGRKAKAYIAQGRLVPDPLVWAIAREGLEAIGVEDFILDGYPRTVQQAQWLDDYLRARDGGLPLVISLSLDPEAVVARLSRRRIDAETGESYHLDFNPPPTGLPAGRIVQRPDDCPDAIRCRLGVYRAETAPVKEHYARQGLLLTIDGDGGIDAVFERIRVALEDVQVVA